MFARLATLSGLALLLAGCQLHSDPGTGSTWPTTASLARTSPPLEQLEPPARPVRIAVYAFPDLTGAYKPNLRYADYSRAVTQGASAVLVDALVRAGGGTWFSVVERGGLDNLLKERELIQATYSVLQQGASPQIAPLEFAEYLLEGGITSFDNEFEAGGVGAAYLGVKGDVNYRKDRVTVALRMTAVRTGAVVLSVTSSRTLYSVSVSAGLSRYVSSDLLNASGGITRVDPTQLAVQEAIEAAVLQLIQDGAEASIWSARAAPAAMRASPAAFGRPLESAEVIHDEVPAGPGRGSQPNPARPAPARPGVRPPAEPREISRRDHPESEGFWLQQLRQ